MFYIRIVMHTKLQSPKSQRALFTFIRHFTTGMDRDLAVPESAQREPESVQREPESAQREPESAQRELASAQQEPELDLPQVDARSVGR